MTLHISAVVYLPIITVESRGFSLDFGSRISSFSAVLKDSSLEEECRAGWLTVRTGLQYKPSVASYSESRSCSGSSRFERKSKYPMQVEVSVRKHRDLLDAACSSRSWDTREIDLDRLCSRQNPQRLKCRNTFDQSHYSV